MSEKIISAIGAAALDPAATPATGDKGIWIWIVLGIVVVGAAVAVFAFGRHKKL